jgi:hypothetical protein
MESERTNNRAMSLSKITTIANVKTIDDILCIEDLLTQRSTAARMLLQGDPAIEWVANELIENINDTLRIVLGL